MSKKTEEAAMKAYPEKDALNKKATGHYDPNYPRRKAYQYGYEQAEKDTIERACEWLFAHLTILVDYYDEDIHEKADRSEFIKLFRKQMEEE